MISADVPQHGAPIPAVKGCLLRVAHLVERRDVILVAERVRLVAHVMVEVVRRKLLLVLLLVLLLMMMLRLLLRLLLLLLLLL